jgi:hypothetical protein
MSGRLLLAVGVLALSWLTVRLLVDLSYRDADTPIYQRYGELIERGLVPYRDFAFEYPPGALAPVAPPAFVTETLSGYMLAFEALVFLCALLVLVATDASLRRLRAPRAHSLVALFAIALSPLALSTVAFSRYDFLPAALVALWLALELRNRHWAAAAVLGLGIAAKLYPLALLPIAFVWVGRRRDWREAALAVALTTAVCAVCFLPFVVLSPGGVADSLLGQLRRPLQLESLGAGLLLAGHRLFGVDVSVETSSGSVNLVGGVPDLFATASSVVQVALVLFVYLLVARKAVPTQSHLVLASAAVVTALVATGKVFSPQFLLWLIVLVPLVPGLLGRRAAVACLLAMLVTTSWFPFRYFALTQAAALQTTLLFVRNAVLLALLALLVRRLWRETGPLRPAAGLALVGPAEERKRRA